MTTGASEWHGAFHKNSLRAPYRSANSVLSCKSVSETLLCQTPQTLQAAFQGAREIISLHHREHPDEDHQVQHHAGQAALQRVVLC